MRSTARSDLPHQQELASIIASFADSEGEHHSAVLPLSLYRRFAATAPTYGVYEFALILVAQGAKRAVFAGKEYDYHQTRYLVTLVDLLVTSQVTKLTADAPYLCLLFKINPRRIRDLTTATSLPKPATIHVGRGMSVGQLSVPLFDAAHRRVRRLNAPQDIPILTPLIEREILYRLLTGEQGMPTADRLDGRSAIRLAIEAIHASTGNTADSMVHRRCDRSPSSSRMSRNRQESSSLQPPISRKKLEHVRRLAVSRASGTNALRDCVTAVDPKNKSWFALDVQEDTRER